MFTFVYIFIGYFYKQNIESFLYLLNLIHQIFDNFTWTIFNYVLLT